MWDNEDAMEYKGQTVALTCVKCHQTGERIVLYCGPDQRIWNYDDVPVVPMGRTVRIGRLIWKPKEPTNASKQCQLDGEHFHLHCQHCQFKWTEQLVEE